MRCKEVKNCILLRLAPAGGISNGKEEPTVDPCRRLDDITAKTRRQFHDTRSSHSIRRLYAARFSAYNIHSKVLSNCEPSHPTSTCTARRTAY